MHGDSEPDAEAVGERIRARAGEIADAERDRAVTTLDARGELDEQTRATVTELSDALVDELLDPVETTLDRVDDDDPALRTAIELFDPDR